MDPFDRFEFRRSINWQAIVAFILGVVIAYVVQHMFNFGGGGLLTTLIVLGVGGFWYHLRRVV